MKRPSGPSPLSYFKQRIDNERKSTRQAKQAEYDMAYKPLGEKH
jgi:hypothetical protein